MSSCKKGFCWIPNLCLSEATVYVQDTPVCLLWVLPSWSEHCNGSFLWIRDNCVEYGERTVLSMEKEVFQFFHHVSKDLHENNRRKLKGNGFICMLSISAHCSYEDAEVVDCIGQIWGSLNIP